MYGVSCSFATASSSLGWMPSRVSIPCDAVVTALRGDSALTIAVSSSARPAMSAALIPAGPPPMMTRSRVFASRAFASCVAASLVVLSVVVVMSVAPFVGVIDG